MNITKYLKLVNDLYIVSEHLRSTAMTNYIDVTIDDVNDRLNANFPVLSEWPEYAIAYNIEHANDVGFVALDKEVYTAIPNRYLRRVVGVGAALEFFTSDEEGEQVASKYYIKYEQALAMMIRDYIDIIPEQYRNTTGGFITTSYNNEENPDASVEGIVINNGDIFSLL